MRSKPTRWALAIASLAIAASALAAEVGGVKLDERVSVGGKELVLNGAGIRTRVVFKVYVASLYLPAKAGDLAGTLAQSPRRVQMNMLRDVGAADLVGALVDGMKATSTPQQMEAVKPQTDQLVSLMKSIGEAKTGDVVTLDFVDGETRLGHNGKAIGAIAGAPFNDALMKIWLADKPVQADLKKAMLGG
ncbi:MAG: chalcone isomerase family protein [Burkholderiaceae bacterium]|jgi:long-chain acyl-CoA synthetase|nr:chalcone isomerase family protein [Burkholderiaceae bacterium]